MNVVGERVLFFGDSLSHPGPDTGPSIVDITRSIGAVSGAPGELIARQLLAAGAQAVRVNAKVGRSARSFLLNEGGTSLLARDQSEFRPTKVVVWLGTNDIDRGLTPDALAKTAAAMAQIRDAYRAMGAEVFALGPPSYPNAKYNNAAPIMLDTIRGVFGADHTFDIRPLTTGAPRAGDGIHFTAVGAAAVATPIVQMLTAPSAIMSLATRSAGHVIDNAGRLFSITVAQTGMSRGTKIALGVLGAASFVGLSWLALRVAKRAAIRSAGQRQALGALPATKTEFRKRFKQALQASEWQGDPTRGIDGKFVPVGDSGWEVRRVYGKHRFGYTRLFDLRKIGHGRTSTLENVNYVADAIFKGDIAPSWVDEGKLGLRGLYGDPVLPLTLKKTYVTVGTREVVGPRGAPAGFEARIVEVGAGDLFDLFGLTSLTPAGTRNYGQMMREHPDVWNAWEARRGTVHGKIRPRLKEGRYATRAEIEAAAIALARKRGYVIIDADLMRAGLPLDENAGFGAILESKYDPAAKAYVGVPITAKNKAKRILARSVEAAYYWREHDEQADRMTEREAASVDDQISKLARRISKIVGRL